LSYRVSELEREKQEAHSSANSFQILLEAETRRTQLLEDAITTVCDGLGVEPDTDTGEDVPGNSFIRRMAALGRLAREKIRDSLHHGVKRAMKPSSVQGLCSTWSLSPTASSQTQIGRTRTMRTPTWS
jgi:hypothetical protein